MGAIGSHRWEVGHSVGKRSDLEEAKASERSEWVKREKKRKERKEKQWFGFVISGRFTFG